MFSHTVTSKMLYSRNPLKFRYLLLFGSGNYDNRGIFGGDIEETLLTYQTDNKPTTACPPTAPTTISA